VKILGTLVLAGLAFGQAPTATPEFAAASVKPSRSGGTQGRWNTGPGSVTMTNVTLRTCVQWAYGVKAYQVSAPEWFNDERFDIAAKSEGRVATAELRVMMQTLLAQRFQLAAHRETRELAVFALLAAKGGAKLRVSNETGAPELGSGRGGELTLSAKHAPISTLTDLLAGPLGAPVVDMTELTGRYDFSLDVAPYIPLGADGRPSTAGIETEIAAMLSMALQEQLGLKLEARKSPIAMIVIDHAERVPAEN
jgi:uncharacterized protein (TIGR03435 family)